MARIANKLSTDQIKRFVKQTRDTKGIATVHAVLADDEELVLELALDEAREDGVWPTTVVECIEDHAEGQGPGIWRYAVRATNDAGRAFASTWCRIVVRNAKNDDGDDEQQLDGSVGSFVQQLQRTNEEQSKTNIALVKVVVDTLKAQGEMLRASMERQTALEKERAELVAENLDYAAKEALRPPEKTPEDEDPIKQIIALATPVATQRLVDKLSPKLLGLLGNLFGEDEEPKPKALPASTSEPAVPSPDAAPATPEAPSAGPDPD